RVLLVHDLPDAGDKALGLHLVGLPAGVKIREIDHTTQDFAPLAQGTFATPVQALENGSGNLMLADALPVGFQPFGEVVGQVRRHTCPLKEQEDVVLRLVQQRNGVNQQVEQLRRVVERDVGS